MQRQATMSSNWINSFNVCTYISLIQSCKPHTCVVGKMWNTNKTWSWVFSLSLWGSLREALLMYQRHLTFKLLSSTPDETVRWILLSWAAADWMHCWKDDETTMCVDYTGSIGWGSALTAEIIIHQTQIPLIADSCKQLYPLSSPSCAADRTALSSYNRTCQVHYELCCQGHELCLCHKTEKFVAAVKRPWTQRQLTPRGNEQR